MRMSTRTYPARERLAAAHKAQADHARFAFLTLTVMGVASLALIAFILITSAGVN